MSAKTRIYGKGASDLAVVGLTAGLAVCVGYIVYSYRQATALQAQADAYSSQAQQTQQTILQGLQTPSVPSAPPDFGPLYPGGYT
jgi:hypothetical protein